MKPAATSASRQPPAGWAIFDLDGTLVDSQPHVLWSLQQTALALDLGQVAPVRLGAPLRELLVAAFALPNEDALGRAIEVFRTVHDREAAAGCKPYDGALTLWNGLRDAGVRLSVATNKREGPARAILRHWGFADGMSALACTDSPRLGGAASKTQMVASLLRELEARASASMMFGDSHEDMAAASACGLQHLIFAAWGYGRQQDLGRPAASPLEALSLARTLLRGPAAACSQ